MENLIVNLFAFFGVILGSGVLVALVPSLLSILPGAEKKYYTIIEPVSKEIEPVVMVEAPRPVRYTYVEKTLLAREPQVEAEWIEAVEQDVHAGEWCYVNCEETLEMPESYVQVSEIDATLALIKQIDAILAQAEKVIALANEFDMACNEVVLEEKEEIVVDESDHPDTCVCFVCCPFGVNSMGGKISKVKANTQALLQDLDTIGNPDRADAFFSRGYKSTDSDLPPGFYDDDNLAQDWYDNQLYV